MENCVILKWNPRISSFKYDNFLTVMHEYPDMRLNWSVWEYDKVQVGDRVFMVKVGEGVTGIVLSGRIAGKPYQAEDWSGCGRTTYYCDLSIEWMSDVDKAPIIETSELEQAIPEFRWDGGHSGVVLEKRQADKLENLYAKFLDKLQTYEFEEWGNRYCYYNDDDLAMIRQLPVTIETCINMIVDLKASKQDLDGKPAYFHSLQVGMAGADKHEQVVGFLHDYVEDGGYWAHIMDVGVDADELRALMLLTHDKKTVGYYDYIQSIIDSRNPLAIKVKYNDLKNNLERGRAGNHLKQVAKHEKALAMLLAAYPWLEIRSL